MSKAIAGVETKLMNLKAVQTGHLLFKIPSYQRPYVWSDDDVLKLFDDIHNACVRQEPNYFIGTTLSSRVDDSAASILELVDGQQRTTTLMLICLAFKHAKVTSDLAEVAVYREKGDYHNTPRLQFDIRESVQQLFGAKAGLEPKYQAPSPEEIESNPYLTQINKALVVLVARVKALEEGASGTDTSKERVSAAQLSKFIFEQVQWVNNIVPPGTDLNRLFATMNTEGVQLEQSDILKAKLFKHVKAESKPRYEAIWAACEQMDNYFERNVRLLFPATDWSGIKPEELSTISERFKSKPPKEENGGDQGGLNIGELLVQSRLEDTSRDSRKHKPEQGIAGTKSENHDPEGKTVYCRSIISFPLLLIHAYRIYRLEQEPSLADIHKPVHSKYLLETFKPLLGESYVTEDKAAVPAVIADEASIKRFFDTLWRVRYAFDRWVVKWVERDDDDEAKLGLTDQTASGSGKNRYINRSPRGIGAMLMLQSVRYYTSDRSAQYWLTPFLAGLIRCEAKDNKAALELLERIDNQMSLAAVTRKASSFALAGNQEFAIDTWAQQEEYFQKPHGTGFEHYWFQKLEYVLWLQFKLEIALLHGEDKRKFDEFRITSKNSVEHVHPQNEENRKTLLVEGPQPQLSEGARQDRYDPLNAFGNLVLLSPGENSSYSNQTVLKKKADFIGKPQLSSLKLHKIFAAVGENAEWDIAKIEAHQQEMIDVLFKHYQAKGDDNS